MLCATLSPPFMPFLRPTLTHHCQKALLRSNSKPQHITKREDSKTAFVSVSNVTLRLSSNQKGIEGGEQRGHRKPEPQRRSNLRNKASENELGVRVPGFKSQPQHFLRFMTLVKPVSPSVLPHVPMWKRRVLTCRPCVQGASRFEPKKSGEVKSEQERHALLPGSWRLAGSLGLKGESIITKQRKIPDYRERLVINCQVERQWDPVGPSQELVWSRKRP